MTSPRLPLPALAGWSEHWLARSLATGVRLGDNSWLSQGEADRWRRDLREAAYLELLSVRGQLARVYIQTGDAMQRYTRRRRDDSLSFDFEYWEGLSEPLWTRLDEARARVQIYGSAVARTAAEAWIPNLYSEYGIATRPGGAFGAGIRQTVAEEEARGRDPFIALIRREIGITDQ